MNSLMLTDEITVDLIFMDGWMAAVLDLYFNFSFWMIIGNTCFINQNLLLDRLGINLLSKACTLVDFNVGISSKKYNYQ